MDIGSDPPLRRLAPGALFGLRRALLAQIVDGLLQVAAGLLQSGFAVHHARAGLGAQLGHQFCGNLFHGRHASFHSLIKTPPSRREARGRRSVYSSCVSCYAFSPVPTGSAGGGSSVFIRAAIASGFGRRLRRAGRFLRSPSTSPSPVSVEYVVPSPSSLVADSRSGIWC